MAVRGLDDEPVREKARLGSVNSCKSFDATSEPAVLQRWLLVRASPPHTHTHTHTHTSPPPCHAVIC